MMDRKEEIDILKGIGIFSVIAGHVVPGFASEMMFLFHMPLFFMVSGYLFKADSNHSQFLKNKAISLLIPYFVYLGIFSAPNFARLATGWVKDPTFESALHLGKEVVKVIWGGRLLTGVLGVFWFVTCLYITLQVYNYIYNRFSAKRTILLLACVLYVLAMVNQNAFQWLSFPWGINIVLCSLFFLSIGHIFGQKIFTSHEYKLIVISLLIALVSAFLVFEGYKMSFNMKYSYYGWFVLSPAAAIAFTHLIAVVSHGMKRLEYVKDFLAYSGKASATVMFTHQFFHVRFEKYSSDFPWGMSLLIFFVCIGIHYLLSLSAVTRLLFLGSRHDLKLLTSKFNKQARG